MRIDEPAPAGERPGAQAGFFAEEITGNERLQAFAQRVFDLYVDGCFGARAARSVRAKKLGLKALAFVFDDGDRLEKDRREVQPL